MYRKIIVGHDLNDGGRDALALAQAISEPTGATLVVAGVVPVPAQPFQFPAAWSEAERRMKAEIEQAAAAVGAEAETLPSSSPARGLYFLAEEIDADLVVVGSSARGKAGRLFAGGVGLGLLQGSPCAVAIAPRGYRGHDDGGLNTIVVGYDGTHESDLALRDAIVLAEAGTCKLKLVSVAEVPPILHGEDAGHSHYRELRIAIEKQVGERLDQARMTIPDEIDAEAIVVNGDPAEEIAAAARLADVLVVGSRAYGPLRRVLLGSVSSTLIRSAPCPVIVHPRGAEAEADAEAGDTADTAAR